MNKRLVVGRIIAQLGESLENMYKAARASRYEATHESSKAENKYDTRGLEAGYLAQGQMRQAEETEQAIEEFQKLSTARVEDGAPVVVGALVEVEVEMERRFFFIGPRGGGVIVELNGKEIVVLTPQAPLGQLLMGKKSADRFKFKQGSSALQYVIKSVC
jgi:transcription elongation GreA/GreB family factor